MVEHQFPLNWSTHILLELLEILYLPRNEQLNFTLFFWHRRSQGVNCVHVQPRVEKKFGYQIDRGKL